MTNKISISRVLQGASRVRPSCGACILTGITAFALGSAAETATVRAPALATKHVHSADGAGRYAVGARGVVVHNDSAFPVGRGTLRTYEDARRIAWEASAGEQLGWEPAKITIGVDPDGRLAVVEGAWNGSSVEPKWMETDLVDLIDRAASLTGPTPWRIAARPLEIDFRKLEAPTGLTSQGRGSGGGMDGLFSRSQDFDTEVERLIEQQHIDHEFDSLVAQLEDAPAVNDVDLHQQMAAGIAQEAGVPVVYRQALPDTNAEPIAQWRVELPSPDRPGSSEIGLNALKSNGRLGIDQTAARMAEEISPRTLKQQWASLHGVATELIDHAPRGGFHADGVSGDHLFRSTGDGLHHNYTDMNRSLSSSIPVEQVRIYTKNGQLPVEGADVGHASERLGLRISEVLDSPGVPVFVTPFARDGVAIDPMDARVLAQVVADRTRRPVVVANGSTLQLPGAQGESARVVVFGPDGPRGNEDAYLIAGPSDQGWEPLDEWIEGTSQVRPVGPGHVERRLGAAVGVGIIAAGTGAATFGLQRHKDEQRKQRLRRVTGALDFDSPLPSTQSPSSGLSPLIPFTQTPAPDRLEQLSSGPERRRPSPPSRP